MKVLRFAPIWQTQQGELSGKVAMSKMRATIMVRKGGESERSGSTLSLWPDGILRTRFRWRNHCVKACSEARSSAASAEGNENSSLSDGRSHQFSLPYQYINDSAGVGAAKQGDSKSRGCVDGERIAGEGERTPGIARRVDLGISPRDEEATKIERRL